MFISHKYKFIFLRTPKTASSSLSEFFIKNIPDPSAIYTPVEDSRIDGQGTKLLQKKYKKDFKYFHFTLQDLIKEKVITEDQARTYRVISVLRNPIDRQKSFYYFYRRWKSKAWPACLEQYKLLAPKGYFEGEPNSAIRQSDFIRLNGVIIGEHWLYEDLESHINTFMQELNLQIKFPLPNHKSNYRKNRNAEIEFDAESIEKMKSVFADDFKLYDELKETRNASV